MKFDRTSLGKSIVLMQPAELAAGGDSTEVSDIDTSGYESCVLSFVINGLGEADATSNVTFSITESDDDSTYTAVDVDRVVSDDATYTSDTKELTVSAADVSADTLIARVGVLLTKKYVKAQISNPTGSVAMTGATIVGELGNPTYSTDFFEYDAKPSQA